MIDLTKYEFILLISPHNYKGPSGKFTTGFTWQISATSKSFTVTFNENRYYGLKADAYKAAVNFAKQYSYKIKE